MMEMEAPILVAGKTGKAVRLERHCVRGQRHIALHSLMATLVLQRQLV